MGPLKSFRMPELKAHKEHESSAFQKKKKVWRTPHASHDLGLSLLISLGTADLLCELLIAFCCSIACSAFLFTSVCSSDTTTPSFGGLVVEATMEDFSQPTELEILASLGCPENYHTGVPSTQSTSCNCGTLGREHVHNSILL